MSAGPDATSRLALAPGELRRRVDPASLPFETTEKVGPLSGTIGQPRALEALEFGVKIGSPGYNVFVSGLPGSGRESTVRDHLQSVAAKRPAPDDWVYVHDFDEPDRPLAIRFPAGMGRELAADMDEFVRQARQAIPRAFESEEYARRRERGLAELTQLRDALTGGLDEFARSLGFAVQVTPVGIMSVPVKDGHPLGPEEIDALSAEDRRDLERRGRAVADRLQEALRELRQIDKAAAEQLRRVNEEVALYAVGPLVEELREKYGLAPGVLGWLRRLEEDLLRHLGDFKPEEADEEEGLSVAGRLLSREDHLSRYRVNVIVDHADSVGAPVIVERNASYYSLIGRVDYRAAFGAMVTDFQQIRAGALHRANGGFLVLHAIDVLREPLTWEALKRALRTREIRIENLSEHFSFVPTSTLRPKPVPLDLRVVLVGSPVIYQLLCALDEDFRELFKVKAEFAPDMQWDADALLGYASFIRRTIDENELRHFDRSAVAHVIEYGARLRESQRKLSTRLLDVSNLVTEASYWAGEAGRDLVTADDVQTAIDHREYRSNLLEERTREAITEGTLMIDVSESHIGQVNGLSVIDLGDHSFGRPARVTARVAPGRGDVTSIDRESDLSGPIHSKGVLIVTGYLSQQYALQWPLALRATLTFEQTYEEIDGDSASSTELYALLSALAELPVAQGIAVTGSVNQHGEVQAIGGVNQKIEGFFETCRARGLTGGQGVIIPRANVPHLMLKKEVVEAVEAGTFSVIAVSSIDEGIEVLTGVAAGERDADGAYPEGTVHRLVEERLAAFAERLQEFGAAGDQGQDPPGRKDPSAS